MSMTRLLPYGRFSSFFLRRGSWLEITDISQLKKQTFQFLFPPKRIATGVRKNSKIINGKRVFQFLFPPKRIVTILTSQFLHLRESLYGFSSFFLRRGSWLQSKNAYDTLELLKSFSSFFLRRGSWRVISLMNNSFFDISFSSFFLRRGSWP